MQPAIEVPLFKPGVMSASVDLSTKQFCGCYVSGDLTLGLPAAGGKIFGVIQNKPISGEAVEVECSGITKVALSGNVAAGAELMVDAAGKFLTATSTNQIVGVALMAGSTGQVISALLKPAGVKP